MDAFDLTRLRELIAHAQAEQRAPPAEGQVKYMEPVEAYFNEDDWLVLHAAVAAIRRQAPHTYNSYLSDQRVASAVVDILTGQPENDFVVSELTFEGLVTRLETDATGAGPWLVGTPLANLAAPAAYTPIADDAGLLDPGQDPDWEPGYDWDRTGVDDLRRHLGDWISPRPRFIHRSAGFPDELDTTVGAVLASVEPGTRAVALESGRTRARYALAVWTLVQGPAPRRLWPTLATWAPQPYVDLGQEHKPHEPDLFAGRTGGTGGITRHAVRYELPEDPVRLARPFEAMSRTPMSRSAGALLSATWALHQAIHWPYDVQLTDRMLFLQTAVASLCEDPQDPSNPAMYRRWRALRSRLGLMDELAARGYDKADIESAERRLSDVRNIAAHGADSILVNLGFPPDRQRAFGKNRQRPGDELALAQLYSELRPLQWMIRQALQRTWDLLAPADFDDDLFESNFA